MAKSKRWLWAGGLALGALTIGGIAYAASSSPAPAGGGTAPPPGPGPTPQNLPPAAAQLSIPKVTDEVPSEWVTNLQNTLVELIAGGFIPGTVVPPLNLPIYTAQDVDGNPQNSKFVEALKRFQQSLSSASVKVNTSGKLDYATASLLLIEWILRYGFVQTPPITDPNLLAMAQSALAAQKKMTVTSFPVDGTQNAAFTSNLAEWQKAVLASSGQMTGLRTDGTLDYVTLAGLLVQAYVAV